MVDIQHEKNQPNSESLVRFHNLHVKRMLDYTIWLILAERLVLLYLNNNERNNKSNCPSQFVFKHVILSQFDSLFLSVRVYNFASS